MLPLLELSTHHNFEASSTLRNTTQVLQLLETQNHQLVRHVHVMQETGGRF
eukprot:SAG22_NODE_2288_length_2755_cov_20.440512_4_plen_51_part_00